MEVGARTKRPRPPNGAQSNEEQIREFRSFRNIRFRQIFSFFPRPIEQKIISFRIWVFSFFTHPTSGSNAFIVAISKVKHFPRFASDAYLEVGPRRGKNHCKVSQINLKLSCAKNYVLFACNFNRVLYYLF